MNLNRIDLNLFAVFDAIYTAGSLTKAAEVLCITQPAVSNALSRLREMLNDPLFVRTGHSMTPTPAAQNIIGPAREALALLRKSVQDSHKFDPKAAQKAYRFSMRDILEASLMPRLLQGLQQSAPGISLNNFPAAREHIASLLASGRLDFHLDTASFTDPHICKSKLADDRFVVAARPGHPALAEGVDMATFIRLGHIHISQRQTGPGLIDLALSKLGETRRILMRGQHVMTVPSMLVKTDLIACLPYHFAKHFDLAICELPFNVEPLEYFLYWHLSADQDQAHIWLREQIQQVAAGFNSATH